MVKKEGSSEEMRKEGGEKRKKAALVASLRLLFDFKQTGEKETNVLICDATLFILIINE